MLGHIVAALDPADGQEKQDYSHDSPRDNHAQNDQLDCNWQQPAQEKRQRRQCCRSQRHVRRAALALPNRKQSKCAKAKQHYKT